MRTLFLSFFLMSCGTALPLAVCGDGIIYEGEACDDGGTQNGEGCSPDCELQSGVESEVPGTGSVFLAFFATSQRFGQNGDASNSFLSIAISDRPDFCERFSKGLGIFDNTLHMQIQKPEPVCCDGFLDGEVIVGEGGIPQSGDPNRAVVFTQASLAASGFLESGGFGTVTVNELIDGVRFSGEVTDRIDFDPQAAGTPLRAVISDAVFCPALAL